MNLIPKASGLAPNYWCTWGVQNADWVCRGSAAGEASATTLAFEGDQGAKAARDCLDEEALFDEPGWANNWAGVREDLLLLLDDGWDVPYGTDPAKELQLFGSLELDEKRFPFCSGLHPAKRLEKLNERVKSCGWRGAGLWVAAQAVGDGAGGRHLDDDALREYWRERMRWSRDAGISYWKVDWGFRSADPAFRRLLTEEAARTAPDLVVDHAAWCLPVNDFTFGKSAGEAAGSGRFLNMAKAVEANAKLLEFSAMLRPYDSLPPLSTATDLDRAAGILSLARASGRRECLYNVGDDPYLAAALGCCAGIMRSRIKGAAPFDAIAGFNTRLMEAVRALRWQRIAPAWAAGSEELNIDENALFDDWTFRPGDTWWAAAAGKTVRQGAPARIARGMALPATDSHGNAAPFVVASKSPSGAMAVAAFQRLADSAGFFSPLADIAANEPLKSGTPFAFFGRCASLSFPAPSFKEGFRLWAQDLASDIAEDVSREVELADGRLVVPGALFDRLSKNPAGDNSLPGVVMRAEPRP